MLLKPRLPLFLRSPLISPPIRSLLLRIRLNRVQTNVIQHRNGFIDSPLCDLSPYCCARGTRSEQSMDHILFHCKRFLRIRESVTKAIPKSSSNRSAPPIISFHDLVHALIDDTPRRFHSALLTLTSTFAQALLAAGIK